MAVSKNVVRIGLRVLAAISLIYILFHLSVVRNYAPLGSKDHGIAEGSVHTVPSPPSRPDGHRPYEESIVANPDPFPGDHVYGAATAPPAVPTKAAPTISSSPPRDPSKWSSTSYADTSLPTPIQHLTLTNSEIETPPSILVCVMTKDKDSWGSNDRNFSSFLEMLEWTEIPSSSISLALLTSSEEEYETYRSDTVETSYASVHLILHPGYRDSGGSRSFRHSSSIQHARRVEMARLRNYATLTSLALSHEHVLWIDADVFELSTGLIRNMLGFSKKYPQVGIQTAISLLGDGDGDYDWNAWLGERSKPNAAQREKLREDKGSWTADSVSGKSRHMGDLRDELKKKRERLKKEGKASDSDVDDGAFDPSKAVFDDGDEEEKQVKEGEDEIEGLFRLDAVGATVLVMKASLWRQGLTFATSYLVGTDWKDEGWDGVESEGLCVTARNLINEEYGRQGGVGCWGIAEGYSRHSSG